jgi:hypothetical protein
MTVDAPPTAPARIRELVLENLFVVFSERDPERRLQVIDRPRSAGSTWRWCAMDGSPACTRS